MSARVLKKLQQKNQKELLFENEDDNELADQHEVEEVHLNPFVLLNQQSLSEAEEEIEINKEQETVTASSDADCKRKKKRKKFKTNENKKNKNITDVNELEQESSTKAKTNHDNPNTQAQNAAWLNVNNKLITVELRYLNAQNEMRKKFGKRVVKATPNQKRGRPYQITKNTSIVTVKESWPPINKNITMKCTSTVRGLQFFAFEHNREYQNVQNMFLSAVERTDSDFLLNLIRRTPYHVDSLIQLSELCKMTEDFALAAELIERAVYVLETSLHPCFNLTSGDCRLKYNQQENRAFFIVLFKYAQYLEARACCRTALEIGKLIMSLSPEVDPLAMVLVLDYYAIRSKQYKWFIDYYEAFETVRNLSQLPNMAYSYALALFLLNEPCEKSNKALQYALLMFPGVLCSLLEELNIQADNRVFGVTYFSTAATKQKPALQQLTCLYVCRAKVIWREEKILPWLESNVNAACEIIERKDNIIKEYEFKRSTRYLTPPRAILRHVVLSDYKEKVPLAPFIAKEKDPIVMYDPLPPLDSENSYERKTTSSSAALPTNHSFSMFFQSLLPSFNWNDVAYRQPEPEQNNGNPNLAINNNNVRANETEAGIEVIAEGFNVVESEAGRTNQVVQNTDMPAFSTENTNQSDIEQRLDELATSIPETGDEDIVLANEAGSTASGAHGELTQSFNNFIIAMRDVLNFRVPENLRSQDADDENSSDESSNES